VPRAYPQLPISRPLASRELDRFELPRGATAWTKADRFMASDNSLTTNLGNDVRPWMCHGWAIERPLRELDNQLQLRNVFERRADHT
jgi:hypothetical protein